jgi:hypothetical protein
LENKRFREIVWAGTLSAVLTAGTLATIYYYHVTEFKVGLVAEIQLIFLEAWGLYEWQALSLVYTSIQGIIYYPLFFSFIRRLIFSKEPVSTRLFHSISFYILMVYTAILFAPIPVMHFG